MQDSQRLVALQCSVRRQRLALVCFAVLSVFPWLVSFRGQRVEVEEVLRVERLEVVTPRGQLVFFVGTSAAGDAELVLFNAEGDPILDLGATADGHGAVDLLNADGAKVVQLGASTGAGDGGVRTMAADGAPIFYQGGDLRGNGRVPEKDKPGNRVF